ncbi:unnamed protein product [Ostreobium quekettii]|uniref:peptidyl-tRNA hydrolase n=1 Tax=Ostreobium quekettii TaxID=121088 RepID=A0A8S1JDA8_9CHLO|nr:unnamed protein product [Ostreobium quekettii]|eukprot:evm.model.scf_1663.3 EVM.evm.TU.scf_1663.3   scf_1663:10463-11995(+)
MGTDADPLAASSAGAEASVAEGSAQAEKGSEGAGDAVVVQYVVLRRDLWGEMGWPLGSVVAQACHACTAAVWGAREEACVRGYLANVDSMHKVVLEVKSETQLRNLSNKLQEANVDHKLWVEQPENFATCLATRPYPKPEIQHHFKKLKLCKG